MKKIVEIFNKNLMFIEQMRSGIVYYTNKLEEVEMLVKAGWKYNVYAKGYRLIPPEITLVDISEIKKIEQFKNVKFNFIFYKWLIKKRNNNELIDLIDSIILKKRKEYENFAYHVSNGSIIEYEVRISGSDSRINLLKNDIVEYFYKSDERKGYSYKLEKIIAKKVYNVPRKKYLYDNLSDNEKYFVDEINRYLEIINRKYEYKFDDYILEYNGFSMKEYDVILFIPNGCYKFLHLFMNKEIIDKIMFMEFHVDDTKIGCYKLFEKELTNKNVLIIDSVYSGKTIVELSEKCKTKGANVTTLGLYPKSADVLKILDYIVVLNKILKVEDIKDKEKFIEKIYLDMFKE